MTNFADIGSKFIAWGMAHPADKIDEVTEAAKRNQAAAHDMGVAWNSVLGSAYGGAQQVTEQFDELLARQRDWVRQRSLESSIIFSDGALCSCPDTSPDKKDEKKSSSWPQPFKSWADGSQKAFDEYQKTAGDATEKVEKLVTGNFGKMENALVNFALTGKLTFGNFTEELINDMKTIALQQAASGLLSGAMSLAGSAASWVMGQFATGGYTGPGNKYDPAGIVHAGEFVLRREVVSQPGMRNYLDHLNARGYADGGLVTPLAAARPATGGGAGMAIHVSTTVNVADSGAGDPGKGLDQQALQQNMEKQMKAAADRAVADSWRPGGVSHRNTLGRR
ncbi:phage tail tape measure C-terminal domain-containing protein [Pseudomonas monteilii]